MKQLKPRTQVKADWWDELSEQGKKDYISANPNSKQARDQVFIGLQTLDAQEAEAEQKRQKEEEEANRKAADLARQEEEAHEALPQTLDNLLENVTIAPEEHAFVREHASPGSARRTKMGDRVIAKSKALVAHLKRQPEYSRAAKAFYRVLCDKKPSESEAQALSSLVQTAFSIIADVAIKEGESGVTLLDTLAMHDMEVVKSVAVELNSSPEVVAGLADSRTKLVTSLVKGLASYIQHADLSVEMWCKGLGRETA